MEEGFIPVAGRLTMADQGVERALADFRFDYLEEMPIGQHTYSCA